MQPTRALICVTVLCFSSVAFAQDASDGAREESGEAEAADSEVAPGERDAADVSADGGALSGEEPAVVPSTPPTWWFGAYIQGAWVPSAMLKLFLDEAPTVGNVGFGVTATHRDKDGFSIVLGLGYQGYGFDGPFRISGDPEQDTEFLHSSLGLLHLRGQMLWSTAIVPDMLSFEYGFGVDLGVILGSMHRSEAFKAASGEYAKCPGPQVFPVSPSGFPYCEEPAQRPSDAYNAMGAHYNVAEKRVPPVALVPMLPALALRYTPIRQLAIKLDAAFSLLQFAVGVSAAYGVDL